MLTMKKILTLLPIYLLFGCAANRSIPEPALVARPDYKSILPSLPELKRTFHEIPELAGQEVQTQQLIKNQLLSLGLEVETEVYGRSVIGILKGKNPGPHIAWRSDMDALPHNTNESAHLKTGNPAYHGCGHDVHMAIALGIAKVLSAHRDQLSGTLYFIFQPEEETFLGAKGIIESTYFKRLKIDQIYGLHVTDLPVGEMLLKEQEIFAHQRRVELRFAPSVSKIELTRLRESIEKHTERGQSSRDAQNIMLITDKNRGLKNQNTIFKDYCFTTNFLTVNQKKEAILAFDTYETDEKNLSGLLARLVTLVDAAGLKDSMLSIRYSLANPTVVNDTRLTSEAFRYFGNRLQRSYGQVPYFNDDFAHFQRQIPGLYFLLGGSNPKRKITAMNHAPEFNVDDECMPIAVSAFSGFLIHLLKK